MSLTPAFLLRGILRVILAGLALFVAAAVLLSVAGFKEDVFPADVAVVLGTTAYADGTPSPRLAARLDRAVKLYHEGLVPRIIVSGGLGREGADEAMVMQTYLVRHGIPTEAIIRDSNGINTAATARFTTAWMKERNLTTVLAVSQYFHLPRTRMTLRRAGAPTVGTACAPYWELRDFFSVSREVPAFIAYFFGLRQDEYHQPRPHSSVP